MKNLMTRKLLFGMLMVLVLAFSVQGIADALTFRDKTSSSGDLATELPSPNDFDITFSISPGSDTTPILRDTDGKLIKDSTADAEVGANAQIDGSGYTVFDVSNGKEYRLSTAANDLTSTFVGPRPRYSDTSPQAEPTRGILYVDGSKNVVDDDGEAVYIRSGAGTGDTDGEENDPYTYVRAKAEPNPKVLDANRYHYNEEQVTIAVTGANIIKVGSSFIAPMTGHVLMETSTDSRTKLTSGNITLTLTAAVAATVEIDITDSTPGTDRPGAEAPQIDFTVYVVSPQSDVNNGATAFSTDNGNDGVEYAYDGESRQINDYFDFTPLDNAPVHYSVEGSGRVYVWLSNSRRTSPTNSLFTSSNAPVFLDTNRGYQQSYRMGLWHHP